MIAVETQSWKYDDDNDYDKYFPLQPIFQILILLNRLKIADARAEYGEMNITKLNQRIDNIEDDIIRAKVYFYIR